MRWKKSDRLVKGWILGCLSDEMLGTVTNKATARDVWVALEADKDGSALETPVECAESIESEKDYSYYLPLYRASLIGNWETAEEFLKRDKEASRAPINSLLQTALHVAVGVKNDEGKHFVEQLVSTMTNEDLAIRDSLDDTPLHNAARYGNLNAAKILVTKNPNLPHIASDGNIYPIHYAAEYGHISVDVFAYFFSITTDSTPYTGSSGMKLLYRLIHSDLYDFAWELVEKYPNLAKDASHETSPLKELATREFTFLNGSRLNIWQQLLYNCVPIRSTSRGYPKRPNTNDMENDLQLDRPKCRWLPSIFEKVYFQAAIKKFVALPFDVLEKIVPTCKHIRNKKMRHHHSAVKLAECLCEKIENLDDKEIDSMISVPLLEAARCGKYELVQIMIRSFPSLVYYHDRNNKNLFHIAIENRCENVFNLVYQSQCQHQLMVAKDSSGNTMLHLAAKLPPQNILNLVPGPALQMQRELQWFKEVKKFMPGFYWKAINHDDKTPELLFIEEHTELKAAGEKWMKDTANSLTISAALIATIAFAAAITVPGGNHGNSGLPILSGNIAFIIFAISNAASLFTSTTSLLVFLSAFTSRYRMEDFLHSLPKRLVLGLLTLFLSITFMMVSFSATVYLVFGRKKAWVLITAATMACLPITSFVFLQFPLLVDLISNTYGRGVFGKKTGRLFY